MTSKADVCMKDRNKKPPQSCNLCQIWAKWGHHKSNLQKISTRSWFLFICFYVCLFVFWGREEEKHLLYWYFQLSICDSPDDRLGRLITLILQRHSHLTGEDWWRQIRRFQQPITAQLCNLSVILPQPMASAAAGLKPCLLSAEVKGLKRNSLLSNHMMRIIREQQGLFHHSALLPKMHC